MSGPRPVTTIDSCTLRVRLGIIVLLALHASALRADEPAPDQSSRPNLLLVIADDWGWPHAGAYGDSVVSTPAFDRLAREGALFHHAYCASPSCTPSRGAVLTGQHIWRLGEAANLWSVFPDHLHTYPEMLAQAGYLTGSTGKAWGPGRTHTRGRPLAGTRFKDFATFLESWSADQPFCFWLGSSDPHRPYEEGVGAQSGIAVDEIQPPACFPNVPPVRGDIADYYWHVARFDRLLADAIAALQQRGALDQTLIVVTSDHGFPFPRGKGNLYDTGSRVPLAVRWPQKFPPGTEINSFVSLTDLAPTFLAAAGVDAPADMTGHSILDLAAPDTAAPPAPRDFVLFGRERHVPAQAAPDMGGYPSRALRTHDYLYILNFRPDRWPAGTPDWQHAAIPGAWLADCDNGPTKLFLATRQSDDASLVRFYDLAFAKRPAEELYDLQKDPHQLQNVAQVEAYQATRTQLHDRLLSLLKSTRDPRVQEGGEDFDSYDYLGGAPKHPDWRGTKKTK